MNEETTMDSWRLRCGQMVFIQSPCEVVVLVPRIFAHPGSHSGATLWQHAVGGAPKIAKLVYNSNDYGL